MKLRAQVLVVGGGPAGSAAARFLAAHGMDVLMAERNLSFEKPCGGGIPSGALPEVGVPEPAVKKRVHALRVISPAGEALDVELGGDSIAIVERGEFDRILRDEAVRSGVRLLDAEFRCFENLGRTVTAQLVAPRTPYGMTVQADFVVAADGVNSRVRAALKIRPSSSLFTLSAKMREEESDACEFWFGASHAPRGYSWIFPRSEGISAGTAVFGQTRIKDLWQQFLMRRALISRNTPRGYRIPLWQGDLYHAGRVLFAGDAAGQVMPFTCEGIYYAMKSGEFAARALIEGRIGDYKKLWEKRFQKRFVLMKGLWAYFLKGDQRAEKIVQVHRRPEVREMSLALWLKKDLSRSSLLSYIDIFRRFLN